MPISVRMLVLERDQHRCVRCGEYGTPFGDYSLHHRRPRGMGGSKRPDTNLPANIVTLCGSGVTGCHGHIESHREEAREMGLLLHQGQHPDTEAVLTHRGWLLLDNDGDFARLTTDGGEGR